jgi:hypothetical protein
MAELANRERLREFGRHLPIITWDYFIELSLSPGYFKQAIMHMQEKGVLSFERQGNYSLTFNGQDFNYFLGGRPVYFTKEYDIKNLVSKLKIACDIREELEIVAG